MTLKTDGTGPTKDRARLRAATSVWFVLLAVSAFGAEQIAMLDPRMMIVTLVLITTGMFTCMQIVIRETIGASKPKEYIGNREMPRRTIQQMIVRNLIISSSIFALMWACNVFPVG